ncbi:hypothetical protein GZL_05699 [Streptomyces sp. 769]|nr:hypothetical protein GZL_05699 [Streptomyces sp. 769]
MGFPARADPRVRGRPARRVGRSEPALPAGSSSDQRSNGQPQTLSTVCPYIMTSATPSRPSNPPPRRHQQGHLGHLGPEGRPGHQGRPGRPRPVKSLSPYVRTKS